MARIEGRTPIQVTINVEPTTPCVTNTLERTPTFRQPNFSGRKTIRKEAKKGATTRGANSGTNSQISTLRGGSSSTQFKIVGHDPMIRLPKFWGEEAKDPEHNLFICKNIWESKNITNEDTKLTKLAIVLRDHALDWYMSLDVNSPPRLTRTIGDVKKLLINEF
jgi:hypothetical protein